MKKKGFDVFKGFLTFTKLKSSKKILENQEVFNRCLKGVRGDTQQGISRKDAATIMKYHLNSRHWTSEQVDCISNDPRTIHLFATKKRRDAYNEKQLMKMNSSKTPVAVILSISEGNCGCRKSDHYDEDRCPKRTMFCVGCRVSLVGVNINPEMGLHHSSMGIIMDIVYETTTGPQTKGSNQEKIPAYVLVDFNQYCGPKMYQNNPY